MPSREVPTYLLFSKSFKMKLVPLKIHFLFREKEQKEKIRNVAASSTYLTN